MNDSQKESSSAEEEEIQEFEDSETGRRLHSKTDLKMKIIKETVVISEEKLSADDLKRPPLRKPKKHSPKKIKDLDKIKVTEKLSTPRTLTDSSAPSYTWLIICFGLLLASVILGYYFAKSSGLSGNQGLDVEKVMTDLKSKFNNQPSLTYRVIKSAIKRGFSEDTRSPGIIVLISSREAKETTQKLATTLVKLLSEPQNSVLIDTGVSPSKADHLKKEIDVAIKGNLTEKQMRAVLVANLDQLPFEAAMIFHSYCDHENAPFKRVVYVMTAFVDEAISPDSDSKQWDVLASKRLRYVWQDSGEDQVVSLISRLTVSVAAVVPN